MLHPPIQFLPCALDVGARLEFTFQIAFILPFAAQQVWLPLHMRCLRWPMLTMISINSFESALLLSTHTAGCPNLYAETSV